MSEEEKKAIEYLKNRLEILHNNTQWATENNIKVVLNLIEKQQKEIEEFYREININTEIHKRDMKIKELEEVNNCLHESSKELFISKDKIREKTKELNNEMLNEKDSLEMFYRKKYCKEVLEELLEE